MKLWRVGKIVGDYKKSLENGKVVVAGISEFIGTFDTEEKAKRACSDDTYFVIPLELNAIYDETEYPVGQYFPLSRGPGRTPEGLKEFWDKKNAELEENQDGNDT